MPSHSASPSPSLPGETENLRGNITEADEALASAARADAAGEERRRGVLLDDDATGQHEDEVSHGPYNGTFAPGDDEEDSDNNNDLYEDPYDDYDPDEPDDFEEEFERELHDIPDILSDDEIDELAFFALKNDGSGLTDETYRKMRYLPAVKRADLHIPSFKKSKKLTEKLSGVRATEYDCCVNSCVCYVGPNEGKTMCPYCGESRTDNSGKPRRRYRYIPITPRLRSFYQNADMAKKMRYRHDSRQDPQRQPDTMYDLMDGTHYDRLTRLHVIVNNKEQAHRFFDDHHDVALGLSTDGFAPFRRRSKTCWPIVLFNYNLPPEIRFLFQYILCVGVVPGPNKPKDFDSYLWPLIEELLRLAVGVPVYDTLDQVKFKLHAYLIVAFGDIPAMSMLMRMKGHNAFLPCRMCRISGVRIPDKPRVTTHYVPLNRAAHPSVQRDVSAVKVYNPTSLPLRTHEEIMREAQAVESAPTTVAANTLARESGINGSSILYHLPSISFPTSFPYDFMHLVFENVMRQLILLWTGGIEGLDEGKVRYQLAKDVWAAIGEATGLSGKTIPSIFTGSPPNCAEPKGAATADSWSFWLLYLGPRLLARQFRDEECYSHFVALSRLVHKCLQFEITKQEIAELREGFADWVEKFEQLYYQHNASRISVCTLNIHALLHIADSIEAMGPVWTYWAFPMERFCGRLQRAIHSRRFPWSNLDEHIVATAQIRQVILRYSLEHLLSFKPDRKDHVDGQYAHASYPTCILLPKRRGSSSITDEIALAIKTQLATRYDVSRREVERLFKKDFVVQFARVRRLEGGDDMCAAEMLPTRQEDLRDRTYIKYVALVDTRANNRSRAPNLVPRDFYGKLLNILLVTLPPDVAKALDADHRSDEPAVLFLARVQACDITGSVSRELPEALVFKRLKTNRPQVVDITTVQCLIGRTPLARSTAAEPTEWAIIDRSSGEINSPEYDD